MEAALELLRTDSAHASLRLWLLRLNPSQVHTILLQAYMALILRERGMFGYESRYECKLCDARQWIQDENLSTNVARRMLEHKPGCLTAEIVRVLTQDLASITENLGGQND